MPLNPSLDRVGENAFLALWGERLRRHPAQVNALQEADAELVPLPGTGRLLAVTTDTVAEEIALGFYRDAETVGWVAAAASLSDLAAVGAEPVGLLTAVTLPRETARAFAEGLARGLDAAACAAGTYILGGDTNLADAPSVTTTAIGTVGAWEKLTREGCVPGDVVYASGRLGAGALPVMRAMGLPVPGDFRPAPRLREARLLAGRASACMDTSDGLVATLDQLARLNGVGFDVTARLADVVVPAAHAACRAAGLDPLLALAQPHGEFELVFTMRAERAEAFERYARANGFAPLRLGVATAPTAGGDALVFSGDGAVRALDGARIRNLHDETGGDLGRYAAALAALLAATSPPPRAPGAAGLR